MNEKLRQVKYKQVLNKVICSDNELSRPINKHFFIYLNTIAHYKATLPYRLTPIKIFIIGRLILN